MELIKFRSSIICKDEKFRVAKKQMKQSLLIRKVMKIKQHPVKHQIKKKKEQRKYLRSDKKLTEIISVILLKSDLYNLTLLQNPYESHLLNYFV